MKESNLLFTHHSLVITSCLCSVPLWPIFCLRSFAGKRKAAHELNHERLSGELLGLACGSLPCWLAESAPAERPVDCES